MVDIYKKIISIKLKLDKYKSSKEGTKMITFDSMCRLNIKKPELTRKVEDNGYITDGMQIRMYGQ